jgi:hypothetical protein
MAAAEQAPGHIAAHPAQADYTYFHKCLLAG